MKKIYQVTLICSTGQFKPISTLVNYEQGDYSGDLSKNSSERQKIITQGVQNIYVKQYKDSATLKRDHYSKVRVRAYDREKIQAEAKAKYEAIKEAKYASGEWKRPKNKQSK